MKKVLTLAAIIIALFSTQRSFAAIYPTHTVCEGATLTLYDSSSGGPSTGGTWSSSNTAVATIGATSGVISGISAGTTIISFVGSATSSVVFTVNPVPGAITGGGTSVCVGSSSFTLSCSPAGGTWSSSSPWIAGVGPTTGVVVGVSGGTSTITYMFGTSCLTTTVVTVIPTDSVSGAPSVCIGAATTFTATLSGGTWTSSNTSVATVSSTGVVTGMSAGTATIAHATSGTICGPTYDAQVVTVVSTTIPGTITGVTSVAIGSTTTLSSITPGGTWSSGSIGIATISGSGVLTGVAAGTAVITYTVTGCSGPASTTATVTVTTPNCVAGNVLFTGAPFYGTVKVWLIKYNPSTLMLSAVDSAYIYSIGSSASYSFCGMGTDSFRIKAACDSIYSTTSYIPTYHTSSAYWSAASVVHHVSGTYDAGKNITMLSGTPTTGPGFIGGSVTTGANKGTADGDPVEGMLIYCVKTSGEILQFTRTNALGYYSFSNLPVGVSMKIYPEDINYATVPYSAITLTTAAPSLTVADFVQHTLSMTITPKTVTVGDIATANTGISVFPNPASGKLNVQWNVVNGGTGTITITDVTGRRALTNTVDMTNGNGNTVLNLDGVNKGLYIVNIKANGVNYNNNIVVE
ncbi:MAG: Ig-like domain-containing protein [Taibaiella sp.]|nr:Ig-like domain-containing protein [Taibaiella sp.]